MAAANPTPEDYMKKIKAKYPAYSFEEVVQINLEGYKFNVKTVLGQESACNCLLYIDHGEYKTYDLRSEATPAVGIKVNSIHTYEGHTGKRLGIALLFYSICWLYTNTPYKYKYIRLDDATRGDPLDTDNFYMKLGFVPEGYIALNSNGKK
jgi:hypothetical protein